MSARSNLALLVQEGQFPLCRHGLSDNVNIVGVVETKDKEGHPLRIFNFWCSHHEQFGIFVVKDELQTP